VKKIILFGILAANIALCQAEFDAVSIKPSAPDARGGGYNLSPGRLNAKNQSLRDLVKFAYRLQEYQVSGALGWMDTEHYEVVATFPAATTEAQRALMMQAMLADRFGLAVHRESKEISGYALVVGKNGSKFHAADSGQQGGMMMGRSASGLRTLTATSAKMADFASLLAGLLGRPVEDRTGLNGIFDFTMEWTPDSLSETPSGKGGQEASADGQSGPTLFTALQESLGLKLENSKATVEVIVIDRAVKASAN
jgi:uncharacterized protein (TIGR03435 family)